jgi:CspA family cold shock protein
VTVGFLEEVIRNAARIEEKLAALGGQGGGLRERAYSIRRRISAPLFEQIESIAKIRNRYAHEPDYEYEGKEVEFSDLCETVLLALDSVIAGHSPNRNGKAAVETAKALRTEIENPMPTVKVEDWVEIRREDIKWNTFLSSKERRLIFFSKGNVHSVKPVGQHRVPLFDIIDAVGYVKMLPDHIEIVSPSDILTNENIPVKISISATIAVRDDADSISRVALDVRGQILAATNWILRHLQSNVRRQEYNRISGDLGPIAAQLLNSLRTDQMPLLAFEAVNVVVQSIIISDPELRDHEVRTEKTRREKEYLEEARKTQLLESTYKVEDEEAAWKRESQRRRQLSDDEIAHQKHLADIASAAAREQRAHELALAKLRGQIEIAKTHNSMEREVIGLALQGADNVGQQKILKRLLNRTITVNDISDEAPSNEGKSLDELAKNNAGETRPKGFGRENESERLTGRVLYFSETEGLGIIARDDTDEKNFVHLTAVQAAGISTLNEGQSVEYELAEDSRGVRAIHLRII